MSFEVVTMLNFQTANNQQAAGLACFQNEKYNTLFAKIMIDGQYYLVVDRTEGETKRIAQVEIDKSNSKKAVYLKINGKGGSISFYASFDNENWTTVAENVDAKNLSTQTAGGFVGNIIGIYTGNNH
jgi:xylan 1,4-beta-xylosidase